MCGGKKIFRIGLEKLKDRCGSKSTMREFRRLVKAIAEDDIVHNHFPDYSLRLLDGDMVEFSNRRAAIALLDVPKLQFTKRILANGATLYAIRDTATATVSINIWYDVGQRRSEEHTSELQSLMRISYAVFCLKK